jgi:hypothetical protein
MNSFGSFTSFGAILTLFRLDRPDPNRNAGGFGKGTEVAASTPVSSSLRGTGGRTGAGIGIGGGERREDSSILNENRKR